MTAAEVRVIRAGLGLTADWLAQHLGVRVRAVQRWEAGTSTVRPEIADRIRALEAEADRQVAERLAGLADTDPVLPVHDGGPGVWPAGWARMIAFRVRLARPVALTG